MISDYLFSQILPSGISIQLPVRKLEVGKRTLFDSFELSTRRESIQSRFIWLAIVRERERESFVGNSTLGDSLKGTLERMCSVLSYTRLSRPLRTRSVFLFTTIPHPSPGPQISPIRITNSRSVSTQAVNIAHPGQQSKSQAVKWSLTLIPNTSRSSLQRNEWFFGNSLFKVMSVI